MPRKKTSKKPLDPNMEEMLAESSSANSDSDDSGSGSGTDAASPAAGSSRDKAKPPSTPATPLDRETRGGEPRSPGQQIAPQELKSEPDDKSNASPSRGRGRDSGRKQTKKRGKNPKEEGKGKRRKTTEQQDQEPDTEEKCTHCRASFPSRKMYKRGNKFACRDCNAGRMALTKHYKETGQAHIWQSLSTADKNSRIVSQKGRSRGSGSKFVVKLDEEVCKEDSQAIKKSKDFLNVREWRKACKSRWGMKKQECLKHWAAMLEDPTIPKSRDQFGWVTMPALATLQSVGTRKLSHSQRMKRSDVQIADADDLFELAKGLNDGKLHRETSIFDRTSIQDFMEGSCLDMENAATSRKGKAKATAKAKGKGLARKGGLGGGDDDERPTKRPRHKDLERDVERISALRARRGIVHQAVSELLSFAGDVGSLLMRCADCREAVQENLALMWKQLDRLMAFLPPEVHDTVMEKTRDSSQFKRLLAGLEDDADLTEAEEEEAERKAQLVRVCFEGYKDGKLDGPSSLDEPLSTTHREVFGDDDSGLSKKKVTKYQKELRSLISAAQVALMGLDDATEEIRNRKHDESEKDKEQAEMQGSEESSDGGDDDSEDEDGGGPPCSPRKQLALQLPPDVSPDKACSWPLFGSATNGSLDVQGNCVRMVPSVASALSLDPWLEYEGCLLVDGVEASLESYSEIMESFSAFKKQATEGVTPTPSMAKLDTQGPRAADQVFCKFPGSEPKEGEAPSASQAVLAEIFQANLDFQAHVSKNVAVEDAASTHVLSRLFCQRFQVADCRWQFAGVNECMLGKMVMCIDGVRFVAGAPYHLVAEYFRDEKSANGSIIGLCSKFMEMDAAALFEQSGFAVVLKPNQAVLVPEGFLLCELPLTTTCIVTSCNVLRPAHCFKVWEQQLNACLQDVESDLKRTLSAPEDPVYESRKAYLQKLKTHLVLSRQLQVAAAAAAAPQAAPEPEREGEPAKAASQPLALEDQVVAPDPGDPVQAASTGVNKAHEPTPAAPAPNRSPDSTVTVKEEIPSDRATPPPTIAMEPLCISSDDEGSVACIQDAETAGPEDAETAGPAVPTQAEASPAETPSAQLPAEEIFHLETKGTETSPQGPQASPSIEDLRKERAMQLYNTSPSPALAPAAGLTQDVGRQKPLEADGGVATARASMAKAKAKVKAKAKANSGIAQAKAKTAAAVKAAKANVFGKPAAKLRGK